MLRLFIICAFWCLVSIQTQKDAAPAEDLVAEYYTTIDPTTDQFTEQDEADATAIWDSDRKEDVVASIIMYRDKTRRYAITQKILDKIHGYRTNRMRRRYWVVATRYVQSTTNSTDMFRDLVFGLTYDENNVLGEYLYNFFYNEEKPWVTIGMLLAKDMAKMIQIYDQNHGSSFADQRNSLKKPFKNMLRAWVRHPREPIEKDNLDPNLITQDATALKTEYESDGWHENRDQIESVLMRKSIKYARAVIQQFETLMGPNKLLENIITDSIKDHDLNEDLANTYSSLARYVKNKYEYIAGLLDKYGDGAGRWAGWILCIAVVRPEEWPKVDEIFKKNHNGDSLTKFITQKLTEDTVMAEIMALAVDSTFKPTSFTKRPVPGDPGQPQPQPPTTPTPP